MFRVMTLLLACWLCCGITIAQTDSLGNSTPVKKKKERQIRLFGEVYDSFTKATVPAKLTLMNSDSTVVDTMSCWTWNTTSYYEFNVPARNSDYIIKATADGYQDTTMVYHVRHIARNSSFELPRMLMRKKQRSDDDVYKEVDMDGVVVTGTKVKLAYRGDTLVYNASAFNLPEGSMLDGLIRQMPGAELRNNGDIYVNGRKVDYLTLNGKDFFKGKNKVMLENLPYYTVSEVKVYDKSTKQSQLVGHDVEKKDYVMDVALKQEYNRGYMGNVETGAGTDNRYMARLFGLYYDDHTRVSLFGNTNNINENRTPGAEGEWTPSDMPQGLRTTRQTGLHLNTEDKDKNWEEELDATFDWNDADDWSRTASERFASNGNITSGAESMSRQKDFGLSASNYFQMKKPFTLWTSLSMNYNNGHRSTSRQDSTYNRALVNRTMNSGMNRYRTLNLNANIGFHHKFAWGDYISAALSGNYKRQKPSDAWGLSHTYYAQYDLTEVRHTYTDSHSDSYRYDAQFSYVFQLLNRWFVDTGISYAQNMENGNNSHHRLDWLDDEATLRQQTEWLPSTREALMSVRDYGNSDYSTALDRTYRASIEVLHATEKEYFTIRLPLENVHQRLSYDDYSMDTISRRSYVNFTPSISWNRWGVNKGLSQLGYSMDINRPSLADLLPVGDTTDPLVIRINNPDLESAITHNVNIGFQFTNDSTRHFARLWSNFQLTQRSIGTRTVYDTETGGYIFVQDNISGNWNWSMGSTYEQPLDKAKRLTLRQRADVEYTHSVDFDIDYLGYTIGESFDNKSTVNNWLLHEKLELEYQRDKLTVGISGEVNWRSATGDRRNFERISAFDYNYGARMMYTIPWLRLYVGTDIRMFSRRGYNSDMMNTDDLVWNLEVSRPLLKEKLMVKVAAFDLLHQLSNKQYSVNAQGRTETWNNCIPRFVMISAAYRLNIMPNRK